MLLAQPLSTQEPAVHTPYLHANLELKQKALDRTTPAAPALLGPMTPLAPNGNPTVT